MAKTKQAVPCEWGCVGRLGDVWLLCGWRGGEEYCGVSEQAGRWRPIHVGGAAG